MLRLTLLALLFGCNILANGVYASKNNKNPEYHVKNFFGESSLERLQFSKAHKAGDIPEANRLLDAQKVALEESGQFSKEIKKSYDFLRAAENEAKIYRWAVDAAGHVISTNEAKKWAQKYIDKAFSLRLSAPPMLAEVKNMLKNLDSYCEAILLLTRKFNHFSKNWPRFIIGYWKAQVDALQNDRYSAELSPVLGELAEMGQLLAKAIAFLKESEEQGGKPSTETPLLWTHLGAALDPYLNELAPNESIELPIATIEETFRLLHYYDIDGIIRRGSLQGLQAFLKQYEMRIPTINASESENNKTAIYYLIILEKYISPKEMEELLIAILNGRMEIAYDMFSDCYRKNYKHIYPYVRRIMEKWGLSYKEGLPEELQEVLDYLYNKDNADKIYKCVFTDYVRWLKKGLPESKKRNNLPYIEMPPYLLYREEINGVSYKLVPYDEYFIPDFLDEELEEFYIDYLIANYGNYPMLHKALQRNEYGKKALKKYKDKQSPTSIPQPNNMIGLHYNGLLGGLLAVSATQWEKTLAYLERKKLFAPTTKTLAGWLQNQKAGIFAGRTPTLKGKTASVVVLTLAAAGVGYQLYKQYFAKEKKAIPTPGAPASSPKKWLFFILCLLLCGLLLVGLFLRRKTS